MRDRSTRGRSATSVGTPGLSARGQLPTPAVEGAIAVLLVLGITAGFAVDVAPQDGRGEQLDAYASDAATLLANEPPRHRGGTRLSEIARDASALERERAALKRRVARILPENLLFRVETPHGRVGHPKPGGVTTGTATVTTIHGDVTIRVWYA